MDFQPVRSPLAELMMVMMQKKQNLLVASAREILGSAAPGIQKYAYRLPLPVGIQVSDSQFGVLQSSVCVEFHKRFINDHLEAHVPQVSVHQISNQPTNRILKNRRDFPVW